MCLTILEDYINYFKLLFIHRASETPMQQGIILFFKVFLCFIFLVLLIKMTAHLAVLGTVFMSDDMILCDKASLGFNFLQNSLPKIIVQK